MKKILLFLTLVLWGLFIFSSITNAKQYYCNELINPLDNEEESFYKDILWEKKYQKIKRIVDKFAKKLEDKWFSIEEKIKIYNKILVKIEELEDKIAERDYNNEKVIHLLDSLNFLIEEKKYQLEKQICVNKNNNFTCAKEWESLKNGSLWPDAEWPDECCSWLVAYNPKPFTYWGALVCTKEYKISVNNFWDNKIYKNWANYYYNIKIKNNWIKIPKWKGIVVVCLKWNNDYDIFTFNTVTNKSINTWEYAILNWKIWNYFNIYTDFKQTKGNEIKCQIGWYQGWDYDWKKYFKMKFSNKTIDSKTITDKNICEKLWYKWEPVGKAQYFKCIEVYSDGWNSCSSSDECIWNCIKTREDWEAFCEYNNDNHWCKATIEDLNQWKWIICRD